MEFFEAFPLVRYEHKEIDNSVLMTHILRRFKFVEKIKSIVQAYDEYIINDGETPDIVALKAYGNERYHWIVLMFNDRIDPYSDWVLASDVFNSYVESKYGSSLRDVHHYELNGNLCPEGTEGALAIDNWEYEYLLNEAKRKIKIPRKSHLKQIIKELEHILEEVH